MKSEMKRASNEEDFPLKKGHSNKTVVPLSYYRYFYAFSKKDDIPL